MTRLIKDWIKDMEKTATEWDRQAQADDDRYIALNLNNGKIGDNNIATARGYAHLLAAMAGKDIIGAGIRVAVIGYGIIGRLMARELTG